MQTSLVTDLSGSREPNGETHYTYIPKVAPVKEYLLIESPGQRTWPIKFQAKGPVMVICSVAVLSVVSNAGSIFVLPTAIEVKRLNCRNGIFPSQRVPVGLSTRTNETS